MGLVLGSRPTNLGNGCAVGHPTNRCRKPAVPCRACLLNSTAQNQRPASDQFSRPSSGEEVGFDMNCSCLNDKTWKLIRDMLLADRFSPGTIHGVIIESMLLSRPGNQSTSESMLTVFFSVHLSQLSIALSSPIYTHMLKCAYLLSLTSLPIQYVTLPH